MKGGQATAVPVRHQDGREGVYRKMLEPMSEVSRARFLRELEILSAKVQHRAIVKLFDWSADGERPWYISELGDPFGRWWSQCKEKFKEDPKSLVEKAVGVLLELASALSICHDNGIVHRDIKPGNFIVKRGVTEPWPILIDFGIAHDESGGRLTPPDEAVGNERFSPDVMRARLEEVPPWLDVFDLAQLLIWMLDEKAPKNHWRRPVHWKHAIYSDRIPDGLQLSIKAFTAACSYQVTSPANGEEVVELLGNLFPRQLPATAGEIDPNTIIGAKKRGEARKLLAEAAVQEEVESSAPLAGSVYSGLRETVLSVMKEVGRTEPSATVEFNGPFQYQIIGATDLLNVRVGPSERNIQLRIKAKIVPWSPTPTSNERNRDYWQKHMPEDAICFTFAIEGGVIQAANGDYLDGRWVTINRDGSIYLHPLDAGFGNYANNDLGGSAKGPGVRASMADVRDFAISAFTNERYWEYIATG